MKRILILVSTLVLGIVALVKTSPALATSNVDPVKENCFASVSAKNDTVVYDSVKNTFAKVSDGKVIDISTYIPGKGMKLGGEAVQIIFHASGGKIDYTFPRTWRIGESSDQKPVVYGQLCQ